VSEERERFQLKFPFQQVHKCSANRSLTILREIHDVLVMMNFGLAMLIQVSIVHILDTA
ncbi:MAG: hypothetical protein ACI90V_000932, partial [Bacillariaceae sp.]|jgi:hypothetical protein